MLAEEVLIAEIHVTPNPAGNSGNKYLNIEAAIKVIAESGLEYEVGALGTTIKGPDKEVWEVLQRVHNMALAGANQNFSTIKIFSAGDSEPELNDLTGKYREDK